MPQVDVYIKREPTKEQDTAEQHAAEERATEQRTALGLVLSDTIAELLSGVDKVLGLVELTSSHVKLRFFESEEEDGINVPPLEIRIMARELSFRESRYEEYGRKIVDAISAYLPEGTYVCLFFIPIRGWTTGKGTGAAL